MFFIFYTSKGNIMIYDSKTFACIKEGRYDDKVCMIESEGNLQRIATLKQNGDIGLLRLNQQTKSDLVYPSMVANKVADQPVEVRFVIRESIYDIVSAKNANRIEGET